MDRAQKLYNQAKELFPGGTQLLSKRPEMFYPAGWPTYYESAQGCEIIGLDGKKYIDMSFMGIGACILGYRHPHVDKAVMKAIQKGNMTTLNCYEEVELAKVMLKIHLWADQVRYARTGGEAMAIAVRIARAKAKRDVVLFCGYHGWHDWYLAANLVSETALDKHLRPNLNFEGVPKCLRGTSYPFAYNDIEGFLKLIELHRNRIGVIVVEPVRNKEPLPEFFYTIQEEAKKIGAVLIVDEITAGFRVCLGGAHLKYQLEPDIAVFSKAISNGYPMAVIIGKKDVMKHAENTFISSTYWTERIGTVAALATIEVFEKEHVYDWLKKRGFQIKDVWKVVSHAAGLPLFIGGIDALAHFKFDNYNSMFYKTVFTQEMLTHGILATDSFYASYAHKNSDISKYSQAAGNVFKKIAQCKDIKKMLKGEVCHSGIKRIT